MTLFSDVEYWLLLLLCLGLTAVVFTYPLDVIRARIAFQVSSEVMYTGVANAVQVIVTREGGLTALYRGIVPTMMGIAPYAGLSFYTYETLKSYLLNHMCHIAGTPCPGNDGSHVLTLPAKLLCGGFAGAIAQTVSYPLDVARRRMQLSEMLSSPHKFNSLYTTLELVLREHGVRRGLYRGLCINYMKVTPTVSISFTTYDLLKQWMGLDTHNGGSGFS